MLIVIEGLVMCFILLLICVIGMANGPVEMVVFYEDDVKKRVVELGLITEEKLKRNSVIITAALFLPIIFITPAMVYFLNGAREFWDMFWQMTAILMIMGLFDRFFIDWYWVGHTKAWLIPGTEDLMPYIPKKTVIHKWTGTVAGYPIMAAVISGIIVAVRNIL